MVTVLAIDLGVPIVPAVINGSQRIQRRRSYFINPGTIRVEFLDRIDTKGLSYKDRDEMVNRVHSMILERLDPRDR